MNCFVAQILGHHSFFNLLSCDQSSDFVLSACYAYPKTCLDNVASTDDNARLNAFRTSASYCDSGYGLLHILIFYNFTFTVNKSKKRVKGALMCDQIALETRLKYVGSDRCVFKLHYRWWVLVRHIWSVLRMYLKDDKYVVVTHLKYAKKYSALNMYLRYIENGVYVLWMH